MKKLREFIIKAVIFALLVGLARSYVEHLGKWVVEVAFWIVLAAVVAWLLVEASSQLISLLYFGKGRYSVLLFVLDAHDRILLVTHPYHKRLIPPGGRLDIFEMPHDAINRILREEAGLTTFTFVAEFHCGQTPYTDTVTILPEPYRIQREDRRQRGFVRFHYAFVYVLRADENAVNFSTPEYAPRWFTWQEVDSLVPPERPFDDIVKRYLDILDTLRQ